MAFFGTTRSGFALSTSINELSDSSPSGHTSPGGVEPSALGSLQIDVTYGSSVNSAPAGFKTAIKAVVNYLESHFTDPITVNIRVEYGPIGGLGESSSPLYQFSYAQIVNAMRSDATTSDNASAVASLSGVDPVSGTHQYWLAPAEAKALGLMGNSGVSDGTATFTSKLSFDYNRADGIAAGKYDFFGTAVHEFTEVMGRIISDGGGNNAQTGPKNGYYPLDLFHFTGAGMRTFDGSHAGYFSVNDGATKLFAFNTNTSGDWGDWATSVGPDSFLAFAGSGHENPVSRIDLREMDVLGFDKVIAGAAAAHEPTTAHLAVDPNGATGFHMGDEGFVHLSGLSPGIGEFV